MHLYFKLVRFWKLCVYVCKVRFIFISLTPSYYSPHLLLVAGGGGAILVLSVIVFSERNLHM